MHIEKVN